MLCRESYGCFRIDIHPLQNPKARRRPMDFKPSARSLEFQERLAAFMDEHVYPAEALYQRQLGESGDPHHQPPVMEELKALARERGLWNMFLPDAEHGAG